MTSSTTAAATPIRADSDRLSMPLRLAARLNAALVATYVFVGACRAPTLNSGAMPVRRTWS